MKNLVIYLLSFLVYNILGGILWYNQSILLPLFIVFFVLLNIFFINENISLIKNIINLSGVMIFCFLFALFLKDTEKSLVFQYLVLMIFTNIAVYYLKKHKNKASLLS